ncbi:Lrp/AsnC family transcriptional regulator [Actinomadura madurae]|uniref:Lrp/AsnC family transcriptional regulator n=1 Tax=Actinomadura madurae TaxID=1993 RepID=UPI0035578DF2
MDGIDRRLLELLQQDATRSYAALGTAVGLSAGAVHQRVRKMRERGSSAGRAWTSSPPPSGRACWPSS